MNKITLVTLAFVVGVILLSGCSTIKPTICLYGAKLDRDSSSGEILTNRDSFYLTQYSLYKMTNIGDSPLDPGNPRQYIDVTWQIANGYSDKGFAVFVAAHNGGLAIDKKSTYYGLFEVTSDKWDQSKHDGSTVSTRDTAVFKFTPDCQEGVKIFP